MGFLLEIIRIIFMVLILGSIFFTLLNYLYHFFGYSLNNAQFAWLVSIAFYMLFFVVYRNRLQFYGWYEGTRRRALSKGLARTLVCIAFLLLLIPLFLG